MMRHDCQPDCAICAAWAIGFSAGHDRLVAELAKRLETIHPRACDCIPCRLVSDTAAWLKVSTWSEDSDCPFDCRPERHEFTCPANENLLKRLLRFLQDRQYDPPAYFELDEVAGAIQADRLDVAHIMAKSFKIAADPEGYPSSEIYGFLKSL